MGRRRRRNRGHVSTIQPPARVESLIAAGKWKEAATVAQAQLAVAPTDQLRRQLANCLLQLADYKAAAALWQATSVRLYDDRLLAGMCLCIAKEWEAAKTELESCVKERQDSEALYWLARTVAQGKRSRYQLNGTGEIVRGLLTKARQLACRIPDVYLWLTELAPDKFSFENPEAEQILKEGITANPDSWQLRESLATTLCHLGRPDDALYYLEPILSHDAPSQSVLWTAKECEEQRGNLQRALAFFNLTVGNIADDPNAPGYRLLRGELLIKMGRIQEAVDDLRSELAKPNPKSKCLANVSLAYAHAKDGKLFQAWTYARNAVDTWLESSAGLESYYGIYSIETDQRSIHEELPGHLLDLPKLLESHATEAGDTQTLDLLKYWAANWRSSLEDCIAAARRIPPKQFPFVNYEWSLIALRDGDILRALRHHFAFVEKFGPTPDDFDFYRPGFDSQVSWEQCFRNEATKGKVDAKLYEFTVKHQKNAELVERAILPLYHNLWRKLLWEAKAWQRVYEVAGFLQSTVASAASEIFDYAYAAAELKKLDEAEKAYRKLIALHPKDGSALHNLSLLVEPRSFDEALELQRRAVESDPKSELKCKRLAALAEEDERRKEEAKRRDDFLKTARDRWPQLDYFKKKLLGALTIIESGFDGWPHLAKLTGIDEKYLPGHWRKLVEEGFIIENGSSYRLNEHVLDLIKQERSHAVATTIVRADSTIAFKPIFNSKKEYDIYHVLIGLFPNHLVFPNMSLQTVFQYDKMRELLESADFEYYLKAQVDFCITSTANYLPLIAFEVDSAFHDDEKQATRDLRKNRIFQKGGVNLLRLRPYGKPSEGGLRSEIIKVVQQFGRELRATTEKSEGLTRLTLEIDFNTFGFEGDNA